MEGGIAVFLTLIIIVGAVVIGSGLLTTGGFLRKKQLDGELEEDVEDGPRPAHTVVQDEAPVIQDPREFRHRGSRS
ncbi:MAG TPA: hypothetical protein VF526_01530 [Solirubrobacteraceae bacterium]|jgi:hypothetical protein